MGKIWSKYNIMVDCGLLFWHWEPLRIVFSNTSALWYSKTQSERITKMPAQRTEWKRNRCVLECVVMTFWSTVENFSTSHLARFTWRPLHSGHLRVTWPCRSRPVRCLSDCSLPHTTFMFSSFSLYGHILTFPYCLYWPSHITLLYINTGK